MNRLLQSPLALLLGTGAMLGLNLPLGKQAHEAGIDPFLWAGMIALVPGLVLALVSASQGAAWRIKGLLPFCLVSGIAAYVIPNAIIFLAIPHIGSGLAGLMYALSPVGTAALSILFAVRPPSRGLLLAVALGLAGTVMIIAGRQSLALPSAAQWLLVALLAPVSLAVGNVFRTAFWPKGASPTVLAAASNLLAAPLLLAAAFWHGPGISLQPFAAAPWLAVAQCVASTLMFSLFFRLQWVGGPTYLSQIGYVAAAMSLGAGVLFLGEHYPPLVWAGAAAIGLGFVATSLSSS